MSVEEKYADGKKTGLNWDAPWIPGGPWVMSVGNGSNKPGFEERCRISLEECRAWLRGWRDGIREAHKESTVKEFASWEEVMK